MCYARCDQDGFGCAGYSWYVSPRRFPFAMTDHQEAYQSAEVTTNFFDTSGRTIATKLPDNTSDVAKRRN